MDAIVFYIIPTLAIFTITGTLEKIADLFLWR